jgi:hypothetical protein
LMQGGFKVPNAIRNQPCAEYGKVLKNMRLYTPGHIFGKRLCPTHWLDRLATSPAWLAKGSCRRCHRKRGHQRIRFFGSGNTSECHICSRDLVQKPLKQGLPAVSVQEDAISHGGYAWCCVEEHTEGQKFKGWGPDRRCLDCHHYRALFGIERDPEH